MIEPTTTRSVMEYINDSFPGGIFMFSGDGGEIFHTPDSIIISKPKMEDKFKDKLKNKFPGVRFTFFSGVMEVDRDVVLGVHNKIVDYLIKAFHPSQPVPVSIQFKPCFLLLEASQEIDEEIVLGLKALVSRLPVTRTIYFQPGTDLLVWDKDNTFSESAAVPESPKMNRPDREKVIGKDDLLNLKIELGREQDVMDFINNL